MKRRHRMPFGAELGEGGVRFRLWAPDARRVEVEVEGRHPRGMLGQAAGWHSCIVDNVEAGQRYLFRIDGKLTVPDPASRFQPDDVHGPSEVIDPEEFQWRDRAWHGRPWEEAVTYELHVGTFTPEGTFDAVISRLDELARLGITAIELMPLADFPGQRGWGYDGVLPFAPDSVYGRPEDLKRLVQEAHARRLMVFLDVVYNHFGPEGNYLGNYAHAFFTERHRTPWGKANNFDGPGSQIVRDFFIHNALYWLNEFHFDGLRLDAVHAIIDDGKLHFLTELARRVRAAFPDRHVHLVLENDNNAARHLERDQSRPKAFSAQWNDDLHHVLHVLATGETESYYQDYSEAPVRWLGRGLTQGFAYQGERSAYRGGAPRGEPSAHLPPTAFVTFLQNHDQIGNRAFGERISRLAPPERLKALVALILLAPSPPLLFMGEEWAAGQPFLYFCDFGPELAEAVRQGRREEFSQFPEILDRMPDPTVPETFQASILDWTAREQPGHREWLEYYTRLLRLRHQEIVPRLAGASAGECDVSDNSVLLARWRMGDGSRLKLRANFSDQPMGGAPPASGRRLFATFEGEEKGDRLPPWAVEWIIGATA